MRKSILAIIMLVSATFINTTSAQKVDIYPRPQSTAWSEEIAFKNDAAFTLVGAEEADADAIALLNEKFNTANGSIKIIIGERGDDTVAEFSGLIPEKAEGYYLAVSKEKVIIAGNDDNGTYYGVQSFIQLTSAPNVMCVTITDYPSVSQRGLVEGYYGNPYSEADRMSLFKMFGEKKMNVYIYGPKDDAYHKSKWRENYPDEQAEKIKKYVNAAKANKVEFVWAIHPGEDIKWNDTDRANIVNKLKAMYGLGVRTFAVFFDDVFSGEGQRGDKQAELMNYITEELNKTYDDINPCIICPTQYNKSWSSGNYLTTLGSTMNKDVKIMWTGNSVVDMINKNDMEWINNQISRKAYIWLNYPVSDYCINHLLMGPTYGNDLDIADMLSGFTSNPMEYAEASKVSLFSIADYNWNMENYDADASWEAAIRYLMPENCEAFRFFCENNVDLGSTVHGLRRMNESPEFAAAKQVFDEKIAAGDKEAAYKAVGEQFKKFEEAAETLLTTDEAQALTTEIEPWLFCMKYMGQKGTSIVEMQNALLCENPDSFVNSYLRYKEADEAQSALRARDFEGSLKVATPVVATVHVEPFIKEHIGELIAAYKEKYDYRIDIFPAQVIENGAYYIMYEGKYLTNNGGSMPVFSNSLDDVRPQRQEWKISIDPNTNRYKIINLEDNRYLNEKGEFTVNDQTNPYDANWHTYEIMLLANGKYAIQNAGSAKTEFWNCNGTRIEKSSSSEALPDKFIFDIVPLGGKPKDKLIDENAIYYIKDGNRYLTNTYSDTPQFRNVEEPGKAQEWKITVDNNGKDCYKITSNADGRYINEYGVFGTNQYYSDWNSYLLTLMGDKWSLQWTQSAIKNGIKYITVQGDILKEADVSRSDSYTVELVAKDGATAVKNIDNADTFAYNNNEITACKECESIAIYSVDGRLTKAGTGNRISVKGLSKGLYIAVATCKNGKESFRFTIK